MFAPQSLGRKHAPLQPKVFAMFKKEKIKDLHYIVNGVLTADEIQAVADEILVGYGAKAKLPGFRPGKIPLNILRQKFGASATGEAIDKTMNRDMEKYVADKKIRLAGSPKADVAKDWKPGSDLEYTLEFDILPSLPEIDLAKFTVSKKAVKLDEKDVKAAYENLRKSRATFTDADKKHVAKKDDIAVIDFKG